MHSAQLDVNDLDLTPRIADALFQNTLSCYFCSCFIFYFAFMPSLQSFGVDFFYEMSSKFTLYFVLKLSTFCTKALIVLRAKYRGFPTVSKSNFLNFSQATPLTEEMLHTEA